VCQPFLDAVARGSEDLQLSSEATFTLARVLSRQGAWSNRAEIIALLEEVLEDSQDPDLFQRALYDVAIARNRFGAGRDPAGFRRDLEQLIAEYPNGFRTDDALYQLAMDQYWRGEIGTALATFGRLRAFQGENDWVETAHFRPALIHYSQGDSPSLERAAALLERLANRFPDGDLVSAGHFWAGRISTELGRSDRARDHFQRLAADDPLGYYGLRARLHLRYGIEARRRRHLDANLRAEIRARRRSSSPGPLRLLSPYHRRLDRALASGLYETVFQATDRLRRSFPSLRLEQIGLAELDAAHLVPQAGVLLALRQVAAAAKDRVPDHRNRLEVANAVGVASGDWELAMTMVFAVGETREAAKRVAIMREPDYLAVAYPARFREAILEHSRDHGIPPHLTYAVTRWESYLYHAALSSVGALGLFQIMPATFDNLDQDWHLLETSGAATREAFLLDPDRSTELWTRWFAERLLPRYGGDPFLAVMDHQAGSVVRIWRRDWAERGIDDDLELMVESVRHGETRIFLRAVLASWEIAEAIDVLGAGQ
jgi:soluble lytic murein transglycosylase